MSWGGSTISVHKLTKSFMSVRALQGVNLEVEPGIFGLIGPNGAGKTTLLRALLGLLPYDSGSGQVLGLDIARDSLEIRQRVGVLHEHPALPKMITAKRLLEIAGRLYKSMRSPDELLELVGLTEAADRKIGGFSAGMYQRLGIAHALVGNPELVFLDEPTSNLDVTGRDDVVKMVSDLHSEHGISFFISSHILAELERTCHSIAFMKDGRIVSEGALRETIQKHTASRLRIVTSDARGLYEVIQGISGLEDLRVVGTNTLTVSIDTESIDDLKQEVMMEASSRGITVYAFENADSLEDAYREVMGNE